MLYPHDEIEEIAASITAPEAFENLPLRINVKRWSPLRVERAKADILTASAPQLRISRNNSDKISALFQFTKIEPRDSHDP